jgi:hypothetical protein
VRVDGQASGRTARILHRHLLPRENDDKGDTTNSAIGQPRAVRRASELDESKFYEVAQLGRAVDLSDGHPAAGSTERLSFQLIEAVTLGHRHL